MTKNVFKGDGDTSSVIAEKEFLPRGPDSRTIFVYDVKTANDKHTSSNPSRPFKYCPVLEARQRPLVC